jgi:uncharacterized protein with ParB-like and HNH nuclease domain
MSSDMTTLSKLFDKRLFRIPDYQRGYAWGKDQLKDFWDDLINLPEDRYHYTGILSLKLLDETTWEKWEEERWIIRDKGFTAYHVVDGQQRITTFIILICSILRCVEKNKIKYISGDDVEDIKSRYIVDYKKPEMLSKAFKFGYETDNPSFEFLRYSVLGEEKSKSLEETFYTANLEFAKKYFDKEVEKVFVGKGLDGLEALFRKLVNKLKFNVHIIDNDFDVFVAFETMNNRGKKLSKLELLKNRLIYLTTIYPEYILTNDEKNQLRKDVNEAWKEVYHQLGKNKNNLLNDDEYLKNHWSLFFKYSRSEKDAYIKFLLDEYFTAKSIYAIRGKTKNEYDNICKSTIDKNGEKLKILHHAEIKDYVDSLMSVAQYWYFSYNPQESKLFTKDEIEWILKLNRVGINYYRTLVVASFINEKVTSEQRVKLFKVIEKSLFVLFRMGNWQSSKQSTVAYNFARELMKGERDIGEIIQSLEEKFDSNKKEAVDAFISKMQGLFKNDKGYYSWSSLSYLLFEYEMKLYEKTHVPKLTDWASFTESGGKISIEHIFPQNPKKYYWRNQFRDYTSYEERHGLTHSLGNLLALAQSINSSLQDDAFEDKKKSGGKRGRGYSNGSHSEVEVSHYEDWTPETIKERGLILLAFMEGRWDIRFDETSRLRVLGLEFMSKPREISPPLERNKFTKNDNIDWEDGLALKSNISLVINDILDDKEKQGLLYMLVSDEKYIRFTGKQMREKVGLLGNGTWSQIQDLIVCEIANTINNGVILTIYIGPSDDKAERKRWYNFATNTKVLGGGNKKTMGARWIPMNKPFLIVQARNQCISGEEYANQAIGNLNSFLENEFIMIEEAFKTAPDSKNAPLYSSNVKEFDKEDIEGFLKSKNKDVVSIYSNVLHLVQNKIPESYVMATPNYIALKNTDGNNVCEFHFLKDSLQIYTREPKSEELLIGTNTGYSWTLNYKVSINKNDSFEKAIKIIVEAYEQMNRV